MLSQLQGLLKPSYNSLYDNVTEEFYNKVLKRTKYYKRVSGYFSSKALSMYSIGIESIIENDGYIQFIISSEVNENDFIEIQKGYNRRSSQEEIIDIDKIRLGNLAYLISIGRVDIKFGFVKNGLFHSKWGIFEDEAKNIVYMNGSTNETKNGLSANFDSFDVDFSWDVSRNVRTRVTSKVDEFKSLWNNKSNSVQVIEATNVVYELIKEYNKGYIQELYNYNTLTLDKNEDEFYFIDNTKKDKIGRRITEKRAFFSKITRWEDSERKLPYLSSNLNYVDLKNIIDKVTKVSENKKFKFVVSEAIYEFIKLQEYSIVEYQKAGLTIKSQDNRWDEEYRNFSEIVQSEVERDLKEEQLWSSFYMYTQKRAGNFSVPGSGKTAMTLGVFAYLNYGEVKKIERLLVVSPLSAFLSWKDEFTTVFGEKKEMNVLNLQIQDNQNLLYIQKLWNKSNLILINYESLAKYEEIIKACLKSDSKTILVFDEGHRIKGIDGVRAKSALKISEFVEYKYVLTGTPLPNTYQDIYNILNILYKNEYNSHFGYEVPFLKNPDESQKEAINESIAPYYWRTNKFDLGVPEPEEDIIIEVTPSKEQKKLADYLYNTIENPLVVWIRMLQLSTNPKLLQESIDNNDIDFNEFTVGLESKYNKNTEIEVAIKNSSEIRISEIDVSSMNSPKFSKGIELIEKLAKQGKKVIVWGIFVKTLKEILRELKSKSIHAELIYGGTPKNERDDIVRKFKEKNNEIQILISNPNTMGESVSLHTVAHDAVYFEYNYNLTHMLQSRDRIHRLGLKENDYTRYYYLMTTSLGKEHNFIDRKVYDRLSDKALVMKKAIDNQILIPSYTDDMFDFMINTIKSERSNL